MMTGIDEMNVNANDEFDLLLNDVLRLVANPEVPARVKVQTRVWVREMTSGADTALDLTSQTRDVGHPVLVAAERPAAVFAPDVFLAKMQPRRSARSTGYALLAHAAAILLVCLAVSAHVRFTPPAAAPDITELTTPPPIAPEHKAPGGGGGSNNHMPVSKGQLPKFARVQITPPKIPVEAKIPMPEPAIEAVTNLKMPNPDMPNLGMPNSNSLSTSLGGGKGTGMGDGNGPGLGHGRGGNWGGDVKNIGGGISEPIVITEVEPEFSEEARRAKYPGDVIVSLIVDANGMPQNVHVLHGVGMGLDEKAVEAVKQYRFKPARENGKPVAVYMNVDVGFHIY
jgi:periplasmic protein TonB